MGLKKKINKRKVSLKAKEEKLLLEEFDATFKAALKVEIEFLIRMNKQKPSGVF